jgi:ERCC4-related helicase
VCLHVLRFLFEVMKEGGVSVGHAYLRKIRKSKEYSTVVGAMITDISTKLNNLYQSVGNSNQDHPKLDALCDIITQLLEMTHESKKVIQQSYFTILLTIYSRY